MWPHKHRQKSLRSADQFSIHAVLTFKADAIYFLILKSIPRFFFFFKYTFKMSAWIKCHHMPHYPVSQLLYTTSVSWRRDCSTNGRRGFKKPFWKLSLFLQLCSVTLVAQKSQFVHTTVLIIPLMGLKPSYNWHTGFFQEQQPLPTEWELFSNVEGMSGRINRNNK